VKGRLEKIWLKAHKQDRRRLPDRDHADRGGGGHAGARATRPTRRDHRPPRQRAVHPGAARHPAPRLELVTSARRSGKTEERRIKTGLSDAINIEVLEVLQVTDSLVERPPREIT